MGHGRGAHVVDGVIETGEDGRGAGLEVVLKREQQDWFVNVDVGLLGDDSKSLNQSTSLDSSQRAILASKSSSPRHGIVLFGSDEIQDIKKLGLRVLLLEEHLGVRSPVLAGRCGGL